MLGRYNVHPVHHLILDLDCLHANVFFLANISAQLVQVAYLVTYLVIKPGDARKMWPDDDTTSLWYTKRNPSISC